MKHSSLYIFSPKPKHSSSSSSSILMATTNHLRHVELLTTLPSGAGEISPLNAVILGEALASEEDDLIFSNKEFSNKAHVSSPQKYLEMYKRSIVDSAGFWSDIASQFYWKQRWDEHCVYSENLDVRNGDIRIQWFKGGVTNICYNALDTNIQAGLGDKTAFFWEGNDLGQDATLTFSQLLNKVCQLANYLKDIGVKKGDAVVIYLPMLMELPIAMLACARIGAVHSVVFVGFSSESLSQRIMDCKPKAVITCNAVRRGSKVLNLKNIVDAALAESTNNGVSIDVCLTCENQSAMTRETTKWQIDRDVWWQDIVSKYPTTCEVEWVDAEDPLFLLYTSGSTGKPKGVLHTTGGYMIYTATTFKYAFDYKPSDIYWCTADCGWITGHSYVTYGPLLNGSTVVIFEGAPNYPDSGRCWDIVDKYKVTLFYTAPTLVRFLMREGEEFVNRYSRKSLRVLGSVGEPINPSAWRWFYNVVGDSRCPISDTWLQTETGGFMITPLPGTWPQKPGSVTFPFFGVLPIIVDEKGNEIEGECSGYLCIRNSWPGAFRTLYGDHERYETTYFKPFPGYYYSGDGCSRDKDGYHWLTGRVDDVINVSGHRIGIAEIESALVSHRQCAEAAVVGVEHEEGFANKDIHRQSSKNIGTSTKLDSANIIQRSNSKSYLIVIGGAEVPSGRRLVSLDVFRGLTVALMILVDDAGGFLPSINHSPWNGVTLADFVVPFFIFIVGLSLGLTYKKMTSRVDATTKAVFRTLKLLGLGLLLQGGYIHGINDLSYGVDLDCIRWWGILQRIALAYFLTALCEIWLTGDEEVKSELSLLKKYRYQWVVAAAVTIVYLSLLYGLYVPDWEFQIPNKDTSHEPMTFSVKCGVRGDTGPACNAVGMVDRAVFGLKHLYKRVPIYARTKQCSTKSPDHGPLPPNAPSWCQAPFDPEGLLSSMMAIVTCLIGLHYGHIIVHFKDHKDRIMHWMISAAGLVFIGFILEFSGMHVNKPLYTLSYTCVTVGVAGILFTGIYALVDKFGYRWPTFVLEWMGMHALMIYVLIACNLLPIIIHGIYWKKPENNILRLIGIGS